MRGRGGASPYRYNGVMWKKLPSNTRIPVLYVPGGYV
jgi:hypothetical protein